MTRRLIPLIAIAALAAPLPALAQAWPATVASGASKVEARQNVSLASARALSWSQAQRASLRNQRPITLKHEIDADDFAADDIELRPKAEWTDDQGLRITPTKLAYKQRF